MGMYHGQRLEQLQKYAALKEGLLINTVYRGMWAKHQWQCKYKHTWLAVPGNVLSGSWCPYCNECEKDEKKVIAQQACE